MSIGDLIRAEAKERYVGGELKLVGVGLWMKAADFLDEIVDLEVIADAQRETNTTRNGHTGNPPWAEVTADPQHSHIKDIWMKRAKVIEEEMEKAIKRRRA
jgi:hypothetical protein